MSVKKKMLLTLSTLLLGNHLAHSDVCAPKELAKVDEQALSASTMETRQFLSQLEEIFKTQSKCFSVTPNYTISKLLRETLLCHPETLKIIQANASQNRQVSQLYVLHIPSFGKLSDSVKLQNIIVAACKGRRDTFCHDLQRRIQQVLTDGSMFYNNN